MGTYLATYLAILGKFTANFLVGKSIAITQTIKKQETM